MSWRRTLHSELFIPLVWITYWWPVISGQAHLYIRDLSLFALPMKQFMLERVSSGELPLWTPHISAGMPFLADPSNQILYPGNMLFWLLPTAQQALSWFLILHHLLAMFTFSWLCRVRGCGPGLSTWAGIAYALAGYSLSIIDNVNFLPALAWAPAALAALCLGLTRERYSFAVPGALSLAFMVLAGDPQNAVILVALWGLLCVQWWLMRYATGASLKQAITGFASRFVLLSLVLALLISAIQILPALELAAVSVRQHGLDYSEISKWSFPVRRLVELLQPYFFAANFPTLDFLAASAYPIMKEPWAGSVYIGSVSVLLAGIGALTGTRRECPWLLGLVAALLLSFGANVPYHKYLMEFLPFIDSQRYPEKLIFWVTLISCYLAAAGARALFNQPLDLHTRPEFHRPLIKLILCLAGIILALWGLVYLPARAWIWEYALYTFSIWNLRLPWEISHFNVLAMHTVIVVVMVSGWFWIPIQRRKTYLSAILILGVLDLFWVHYRFVPLMPVALIQNSQDAYALHYLAAPDRNNPYRIYYDIYTPKSDINYVPGALQQRVLGTLNQQVDPFVQGYAHLYANLYRRDRLQMNSAITSHIDYLNGRMSPLQPAIALALEDHLLQRDPNKLMTLASVRYVITALAPRNPAWDLDGFVTVHENVQRNLRIVENTHWLPRALVVHHSRWADSTQQHQLKAIDEAVELRQTLVLSKSQQLSADSSPDSGPACAPHQDHPIRIERPRPEQILITGHASCRNAFLLLNETYSKGWSATLNGSERRVLRANLRFMAIALPEGAFKIDFNYRETRLLTGALLTGLGLILCVVIVFRRVE